MPESSPMTANQKLSRIRAIVILGFAIAVLYHYIQAFYLGHLTPRYSTFLYDPADHFMDFLSLQEAFASGDPFGPFAVSYFPFSFVIMAPFLLLPSLAGLITYLAVFFAASWAQILPRLRRLKAQDPLLSLFALTVISYPVLFMADRGNFEGFVFVLLLGFIGCFERKAYRMAALLLSFAASMKGYHLVFAVLFLAEKRYRHVGAVVLGCLTLNLLGGALFKSGPVGSLAQMFENMTYIRTGYFLSDRSLPFSSSLYGLLRLCLAPFVHGIIPAELERIRLLNRLYTGLSVFSLFGAAYWAGWKESELWKRVLILVAALILIPQISFDYKLIQLLLPLLLFLSADKSKRDPSFALLFGLLLIPKAYWLVYERVSISTLINPGLLLLFLGLIYRENTSRSVSKLKGRAQ